MKKINTFNDEHLWQTFKNGNTRSFEHIYNTYSMPLIQYGLKICLNPSLVEDCLHDLFVELWGSRAQLTDVKQIKFYLIRAMRYKLLAALKKTRATYALFTDTEYPDMAFSEDDEKDIVTEKNLRSALEKLPPRQKEVIYLHFYLSYSIQEIAELLQINYQSVANLLQRSVDSIRKRAPSFNYLCFLFLISSLF